MSSKATSVALLVALVVALLGVSAIANKHSTPLRLPITHVPHLRQAPFASRVAHAKSRVARYGMISLAFPLLSSPTPHLPTPNSPIANRAL